VLVEYDEPTVLNFPGLALNVHPFFPTKHSRGIKDLFTKHGVLVRRSQVPLIPGFAITEYKAQGLTMRMKELEVELDFDKMTTYGTPHSCGYEYSIFFKWTISMYIVRCYEMVTELHDI